MQKAEKCVSFFEDEEIIAKIDAIADEEGTNRSSIIRGLVRAPVAKENDEK